MLKVPGTSESAGDFAFQQARRPVMLNTLEQLGL